jgi:hypothetical protein
MTPFGEPGVVVAYQYYLIIGLNQVELNTVAEHLGTVSGSGTVDTSQPVQLPRPFFGIWIRHSGYKPTSPATPSIFPNLDSSQWIQANQSSYPVNI